MTRKNRIFTLFSVLLLTLAVFPCTALAAEMENTGPAQAATASALYPAEVRTVEENGVVRLEKVYYLTTRDNPSAIPTGDFDREGRHFTLLDVLKNDLSETETQDYIETVTLESATKDMAEIIKALEPEREITTDDGYTGILKPDYTKINVEAAGYKTSSWTVTATRSYPNLSDADTSLIPKSIQDSGRTLTLANVDWQEAGGFFNATAHYSGTASGKNVTGYTVTVEYSGEIARTNSDTVIYTAIFSSENASHGETYLTSESGDPANADQGGSIAGKIAVTAIAGIAALGMIGYGGWRGYKYIRDKKRGYV